MTIAKDFASKLSVAFVAVAMIFMAIAPSVKAAESAEDLQKTINDLLAQVAALQSELGDDKTTTTSVGSCNFMMDLKTGSTGADVKALQQFLNADEDTRVAAAGMTGSAGMETEYYGPATAAAVSKFQVKYRAEILSPAGLVNPTGFFGPSTRAQANKLCAADDSTDDSDDDSSSDDEDSELSGEADLDNFEINDADDTDVSEGDEEVEIGKVVVEFTDGDASISRLDLALTDSEGTDSDAWDTFETISLWVDGEMVAEADASSKADYLGDEDNGIIRFAGLDLVAMEDEEVEISVGATIQDNLDTENLGEWTVTGDSMRFFDADGVATTEDGTDITSEDTAFNIEVAGINEELKFSLGDNNPDATNIVVDETGSTNDVTVLEYTVKAEDGDITLNDLSVKLTTNDLVKDVVSDVTIEVDGESYSDDTMSPSNASSTDVTYTFDIDGDVTVAEDEEVTIAVIVDLKRQSGNYANGTTLKASVTSTEVDATDAEGADDLGASQLTGTAVGEEHTLVATGILVPVDGVETTADTTGDNDQTGEFTIEFEVTAVEGDFYITENAGTSVTNGVQYSVDLGTGTATSSGVLTSTGDEDTSGVFTVRDGETETFTLTVTVDTSATTQARVTLTEVNYSDDTDGITGATAFVPSPASDYRTAYKNINAN